MIRQKMELIFRTYQSYKVVCPINFIPSQFVRPSRQRLKAFQYSYRSLRSVLERGFGQFTDMVQRSLSQERSDSHVKQLRERILSADRQVNIEVGTLHRFPVVQ